MQLVAGVRHLEPADGLAVGARLRVDIEHFQRVRFLEGRVERDHVRQRLDRRFGGVLGGRV